MTDSPLNRSHPSSGAGTAGEGGPTSGPPQGYGLVLVRGNALASARWLRRGLVAVAAVDLPGWTGICLVEQQGRASAPFDVGLEVLAARPTPVRRRPSIGLFVLDGCAVVTVQARGWRADQRWLVWQPGTGVLRTSPLAPLPAALVVAAAGASVSPTAVTDHFRGVTGQPVDRLCGLLDLLGLPGEQLLRHGAPPGSLPIVPHARAIRAFERNVFADDARPVVRP